MPKGTEDLYDANGRNIGRRETGQDEDRITAARAQNTSGLASKVKPDAFVPPKMEPNEDSSRYSARVAAARAAWTQKKAMK